MKNMTVDQYMAHLKTQEAQYQWPIKLLDKMGPKRAAIHAEFPFVITYPGHYGCGSLLDDLEDWCRDAFGDAHGECHWRGCLLSFDYWYKNEGYEDQLDKELYDDMPDKKDKKAYKKWERRYDKILNVHFDMIKKHPDAPEDHSHKGIWTHHFVVKTGYDYGYEDFCFKNLENAFYFKLIWDEEASKRA